MRFSNRLRKIDTPVKIGNKVNGSSVVKIQNVDFKLIGIVNHLGQFDNGHYITLLESSNKWFVCDDNKMMNEVDAKRVFSEMNYLYVS